jgi:small redox-active disulfide protein 2
MEIKVIGSGCAACKKLLGMAQDAVKQLNTDADVIYVTDMAEIMKTGVMSTPGLMVNGKVKSTGRVPSLKEVVKLIQEEM